MDRKAYLRHILLDPETAAERQAMPTTEWARLSGEYIHLKMKEPRYFQIPKNAAAGKVGNFFIIPNGGENG